MIKEGSSWLMPVDAFELPWKKLDVVKALNYFVHAAEAVEP